MILSRGPFEPKFEKLPTEIPIFPLEGVLLLPGGRLPLKIFEPRYLAMVEDALGQGRFVGMVLPTKSESSQNPGTATEVYGLGCAGRISTFSETDDGHLLITLAGVCRFRLGQELEGVRGYRRVSADFTAFRDDLVPPAGPLVNRRRLLAALRPYLLLHDISLNWKALENFSDVALITTISMLCPFETPERQALLEAPNDQERGSLLITLIEMGILEAGGGSTARQ
ncbi:MAG: LON peptidase substrate-binding domain-containing protein [Alphaproteobacteria bacterium]